MRADRRNDEKQNGKGQAEEEAHVSGAAGAEACNEIALHRVAQGLRTGGGDREDGPKPGGNHRMTGPRTSGCVVLLGAARHHCAKGGARSGVSRQPALTAQARLVTTDPLFCSAQITMAVYTEVSDEELFAFLAAYDLGQVLSFKGIAEGVENSNYLLQTQRGQLHPHAL